MLCVYENMKTGSPPRHLIPEHALLRKFTKQGQLQVHQLPHESLIGAYNVAASEHLAVGFEQWHAVLDHQVGNGDSRGPASTTLTVDQHTLPPFFHLVKERHTRIEVRT